MMERNKPTIMQKFGRYIDVDRHWKTAIEVGSDERKWLLSHQVMSFEEMLKLKPWEANATPATENDRSADLQAVAV
jgi:hypothetical protein